MLFWSPKVNIKLDDSSRKSVLDGQFGEFLKQKNKTIFLRPAISSKKIYFIAGLFFLILLIFAVQTAYFQIIRGAYYRNLAENNRIRTVITPSYRGIIYDRNNTPLVKNISSFAFSLVPSKLPQSSEERNNLLQIIADTVKKPKEEIEATLLDYELYSNEAVFVAGNLSHESVLILTKLSSENPSIVIGERLEREYINTTPSFSHLLGYIGQISKEEYEKKKTDGYYLRDFLGKTGVEMAYEKELRGKFGKKQIEINALGQEKRIIAKEEAVSGKDLVLTIDAKMQTELERIMKEYLRMNNKKKAAGIVIKPQNGEILALVSWPSFSNNDFAKGISKELYDKLSSDPNQPLFPRAISGEYPSGSVIKPLWAFAALEEGIITPQTTIVSVGGIKIGNSFFSDWKAGGHGAVNVLRALAESVNTFFYYISGGYGAFGGLGLDKLAEYATIFGIGEKTEIDLPYEQNGFFPSEKWKKDSSGEPWYIGDTYHLSIGQGHLLVTPLQMAVLTSAFANNGILIVPHVLKQIITPSFSPPIPRQVGEQRELEGVKRNVFLNSVSFDIVRQGMRETVISGSARRLGNLGMEIAGKTGTAQTAATRPTHAWFTGFYPYKDPQIVFTVLVEEGGEGSGITLSIIHDFLKWYKDYFNQKLIP